MLLKLKKRLQHSIDKIQLKNRVEEIEKVLDFYRSYQDFRLIDACARVTKLPKNLCIQIKRYLYSTNQLGNYYFDRSKPPQVFMQDLILKTYSNINKHATILEIGPGANPLFHVSSFKNWYGVDKYYENNIINFKDLKWSNPNIDSDRIFRGGYESLTEIDEIKHIQFDLVCGSHSFEHVTQPLKSLKECHAKLKPGGKIALFVPDGFSDDSSSRNEMTHTLYLVPDMIKEFFEAVGGYSDVNISSFRPNADLFITATKKLNS